MCGLGDIPLVANEFEEGLDVWVERRAVVSDDASTMSKGWDKSVPHHPSGLVDIMSKWRTELSTKSLTVVYWK